jgi:hypothetical protein
MSLGKTSYLYTQNKFGMNDCEICNQFNEKQYEGRSSISAPSEGVISFAP